MFRFVAASEHFHLAGDDLRGEASYTVAVFPLSGLRPAFDIDLRTLDQILAADLSKTAKSDDSIPFGCFLLIALGILPLLSGRYPEIGNCYLALGIPGFNVST